MGIHGSKTGQTSVAEDHRTLLPGVMIGGILFLIVTLIIGAINGSLGMSIPLNLRVAENLWSAVLLVIFIGFSFPVVEGGDNASL